MIIPSNAKPQNKAPLLAYPMHVAGRAVRDAARATRAVGSRRRKHDFYCHSNARKRHEDCAVL